MDLIVYINIAIVIVLSFLSYFFIKPKKRLRDIHLIFVGVIIVCFSVLNGVVFNKSISDVLLLINITGAGKSIVLGYGILLGVSIRILTSWSRREPRQLKD